MSDEVHSGIVYKGRKHFTVLRLPEELRENIVLITGPSKAYNVMGLTYGLLIIPDLELREQYSHSMDGYDMNFATNIFGMAATEAAYHPESDGWLDALNRYMQDIILHLGSMRIIFCIDDQHGIVFGEHDN